ncbi:hypothetical protein LEP1GSC151_1534 [Leptospira interrogans serovar Grippotyphosa str. LT2186]|uniref:Uncharacterized protein n=1 Tax=Leptospira interrogans serovar Grippotyphosa str. LT2186 TaxID=1001599 RepID=M3FMY3_LEPIR|nr:hypothetical protein LEP1GSC151_1534 [Leptospira interrogans serovar Grippotyphosa str. LT2186]EMN85193.1 hypothetical protein LEP1GSC107_2697 [Leptospira interrogans serovar Grippotyphosa str. UI 12769]
MQKVCFSDREKFSEPYCLHPKIGKTQHNALSYGSRWKTQHNAFLWVALENSTQRFPMGRVGKLNTTLSYGSRCGVGTKFYRGFVVTPTDLY